MFVVHAQVAYQGFLPYLRKHRVFFFNLSFIATKSFLENSDRVMRSDASTVCEMTEALLERIFQSVGDKSYRSLLKKGEKIISEAHKYSATFKVTKKSSEVMFNQSDKLLSSLPPV